MIGTHFTHSFAMNMQENNDGSTLIGFDLDDYAVVRTPKPETKNTLFGYSFGGSFGGGEDPNSVFELEGNNTDSSISYDSGVTFTQTGTKESAVVNFDLAQNEQLKEAFKFSAVAGAYQLTEGALKIDLKENKGTKSAISVVLGPGENVKVCDEDLDTRMTGWLQTERSSFKSYTLTIRRLNLLFLQSHR